jgi:GntR family transcriptional regulator, arabinose operon transcriptional repressor
MKTVDELLPKHRQVYQALSRDIHSGRLKRGDRLPSEAELGRTFGASRITVGRAVRDLQLQGLVERRAGSGTYVTAGTGVRGMSFGLLIPDLGETDIFEPVCQGMMSSPLARSHALVWGSLGEEAQTKSERAWQLCRQYIERRVSGVFFAPLEFAADETINQRIADALDAARIPIVLLDRTVTPYPGRGHHDLVGIDNRRAGFIVTDHLLRLNSRRIAFVAEPNAAATVDAREAGYREALYSAGLSIDRNLIRRVDPADIAAVRDVMESASPDAIVCANDHVAGRLMRSLVTLGYAIPDDVRIVGIDDVEFAALLPVPLTTLRQPTRQIGEAALGAMLERVARKMLPARDILLDVRLVVRESCGGRSLVVSR